METQDEIETRRKEERLDAIKFIRRWLENAPSKAAESPLLSAEKEMFPDLVAFVEAAQLDIEQVIHSHLEKLKSLNP